MTLYPHICFVGQGPSRGQWLKQRKFAGPMWAEKECARLALLGRIGDKLSSMIGMSTLEYAIAFRRENLNIKWVGKNGKGDNFNLFEGCRRARMLRFNEDRRIDSFILLGSNVQKCFGIIGAEPLTIFENGNASFLCLPHPSGINLWYNDRKNRLDAAKALTSFIYGRN